MLHRYEAVSFVKEILIVVALINFAKTPPMVSREYLNCTWLIVPLPSAHHAPALTHLGPGNPAQFPPREHSAPPIPLFPTRWCQPPVCASVIACCPNEFYLERKTQTNEQTKIQTKQKRTGHDCQQHGARSIALLPII